MHITRWFDNVLVDVFAVLHSLADKARYRSSTRDFRQDSKRGNEPSRPPYYSRKSSRNCELLIL
jgi:hypothetical protein